MPPNPNRRPTADDAYTTQSMGEVGVKVENRWTPASLAKSRDRSRNLTFADARIVVLTLLNALLYWPWHWLKVAFDEGNHYPLLVLGMLAITVWTWSQLLRVVLNRIKDSSGKRGGRGA